MRAVQVSGPAKVEVVEVERPVPGAGEVLVRTEATTVNPVDAVVAAGWLHGPVFGEGRRVGIGWDVVGPVEERGPGAARFEIGDRVAGVRADLGGEVRGLAEYVVVPEADLAPLPDGLGVEAAASIGMNALTADQALDLLGEPAGRELLVTGAAGGVGGLAIELARDRGWRVAGLAREADRPFVEGASARLLTELDGTFEAVFDPAMLDEGLAGHLAPGATVVGIQPSAPAPDLPGAAYHAVSVHPDGEVLADLLDRASAGKLETRVAGTFALADAAEALAAVNQPGTRGRWIVVPA